MNILGRFPSRVSCSETGDTEAIVSKSVFSLPKTEPVYPKICMLMLSEWSRGAFLITNLAFIFSNSSFLFVLVRKNKSRCLSNQLNNPNAQSAANQYMLPKNVQQEDLNGTKCASNAVSFFFTIPTSKFEKMPCQFGLKIMENSSRMLRNRFLVTRSESNRFNFETNY